MFAFLRKREERVQLRIDMLEARILSLTEEKFALEDRVEGLKVENKKLSTKRQIEEEQIAHKLKMREEQVDIDKQKEIASVERKADKRVADVKDQYRDKTEKQLEKRGDELKKMYSEILTRLPDISMAITKEIKEKK